MTTLVRDVQVARTRRKRAFTGGNFASIAPPVFFPVISGSPHQVGVRSAQQVSFPAGEVRPKMNAWTRKPARQERTRCCQKTRAPPTSAWLVPLDGTRPERAPSRPTSAQKGRVHASRARPEEKLGSGSKRILNDGNFSGTSKVLVITLPKEILEILVRGRAVAKDRGTYN